MSSDTTENFERFRLLVLNDLPLQENLRDLDEKGEFIVRVVELGAENGFVFAAEDVEEAIKENYRVWVEKCI